MKIKDNHLRDYLRVLMRRRYVVITFFILVLAAAIIMTFTAKPLYMANVKLIIEKNESSHLGNSRPYYFPYDPEFYETQYQIIKSVSVGRKVVRMLSLDSTYDDYMKGKPSGPNDAVSGDVQNNEGQERVEMLARSVSNSIVVNPIKDSRMVVISYYSPSPELAAMISNSVAQAYMDEILDMRMSISRHAVDWLTRKAEEEREKLEDSERALQEYKRKYDIVTLENRIAMVPEKLSEVANKIAVSETKRKEIEVLYEKVRNKRDDPRSIENIPAIANDAIVKQLREKVLSAEQNITELSKKYGPKHPAMIKAKEELEGLIRNKDREVVRAIESIRSEYELAREGEDNLRALAAKTKEDTLDLNEKFIQYSVLKREVETNKQLFDSILKKIKELDIAEDVKTVNVWVVEKATVPDAPAKPRKARNIFLSIMLGLLGGVGLAFFVEYLDNTVKSTEDIEERIDAPALGMVTLYKGEDKAIEKVILEDPHSVFAEGYRGIRTSMLLSRADKPPRNVLITSVSPQEGKTVTSVNLATTMAQSELSVLLIDGDLRRPRIHEIFGFDNDKGLSTYLAGAEGSGDIRKGHVENLSIITSGPIPPNPNELLNSSRLGMFIDDISSRFDMILWDSAPILTVTDSLILSKVLDGTVLVTRAGKTTHEELVRGLKSMDDIGSRLLGIIVNGFDIDKNEYGSRYYKNYYAYGGHSRS
ncbi:MAG: polysaccharide biosynthesis tyrosine autokinase [Nitrospirota bacterium]|nr:MAG: polysaccharide biosynthesis tyrosine autokinase [Nitrospirota bacterium]